MKTIEELENEIKSLSQELENLKKEKENKRWRGSLSQKYYFITNGTDCCFSTESNHRLDNQRYSIGNYFETERQAYQTVEKLKIYNQLKDLALRLNKGEKIDWTNMNQRKYYIYMRNNELCTDLYMTIKDLGQIYCLDPNFLDIANQEIGEENLLKLFEEE
jgi:hypothetical protein